MTETDTGGPTNEQIAARAYELFLEDGQTPGRDVEHWLRAEAELRSRKRS